MLRPPLVPVSRQRAENLLFDEDNVVLIKTALPELGHEVVVLNKVVEHVDGGLFVLWRRSRREGEAFSVLSVGGDAEQSKAGESGSMRRGAEQRRRAPLLA